MACVSLRLKGLISRRTATRPAGADRWLSAAVISTALLLPLPRSIRSLLIASVLLLARSATFGVAAFVSIAASCFPCRHHDANCTPPSVFFVQHVPLHLMYIWSISSQACVGKESCQFSASNDFFEVDPCPGQCDHRRDALSSSEKHKKRGSIIASKKSFY